MKRQVKVWAASAATIATYYALFYAPQAKGVIEVAWGGGSGSSI